MAYTTDFIYSVGAYILASEFADDGALDLEQLACMTNGVLTASCDEIKEGTLCLKIGIDAAPADITSLSIRFYLQDSMTDGPNTVVPYSDANSVVTTNKDAQDYGATEEGTWVVHNCDDMIADMGNVGGRCYLRLVSEGTAKSKLSEVNIDMVHTAYKVEGITYDNSGVALGSCIVSIFRDEGSGVFEYKKTQVSNATTGAYNFSPLPAGDYMVYAWKADTPDVFDATNIITAVAE